MKSKVKLTVRASKRRTVIGMFDEVRTVRVTVSKQPKKASNDRG